MPRVKIKQLDERVATAGLHLGGGPERRKLEPGEVLEIPEDELLPDGSSLFDVVWKTGKLELTMDEPTRPLDYANYREGVLCAPNFKPRDASEELEMNKVRDKTMSRLEEQNAVQETDPPAPAKLDEQPARKPKPRTKAKKSPVNKRLQRRVARQATKHGAEITA